MSEIHGLREQILGTCFIATVEMILRLTTLTANLEHVELVTPVSRLNIVVESVGIDKGYNAFVNDKILRKRVVYLIRSQETVTKALEGLLDLTC
jgi:hypothetical protein